MVRIYQLIQHYLKSFSGRMVLGMLAVHAVLLPLLFGTVLYIVKLGYEAQFVDSVRTQAYMLSKAVAEALNSSSAQSFLDDLVLSGQVTSGRIVDTKGNVIASDIIIEYDDLIKKIEPIIGKPENKTEKTN